MAKGEEEIQIRGYKAWQDIQESLQISQAVSQGEDEDVIRLESIYFGAEPTSESSFQSPPGGSPPNNLPSRGYGQPSGGGGDMGDIERRVQVLESDVGDIKEALGGIKETLSRMEERLSHTATDANIQSVRSEVQTVQTEVQSIETRLVKWTITIILSTLIAVGTLLGGIVGLLSTFNFSS